MSYGLFHQKSKSDKTLSSWQNQVRSAIRANQTCIVAYGNKKKKKVPKYSNSAKLDREQIKSEELCVIFWNSVALGFPLLLPFSSSNKSWKLDWIFLIKMRLRRDSLVKCCSWAEHRLLLPFDFLIKHPDIFECTCWSFLLMIQLGAWTFSSYASPITLLRLWLRATLNTISHSETL